MDLVRGASVTLSSCVVPFFCSLCVVLSGSMFRQLSSGTLLIDMFISETFCFIMMSSETLDLVQGLTAGQGRSQVYIGTFPVIQIEEFFT